MMPQYKICVYAIAKNEEKFAERWAQSMSEADEITVLDTGSVDKTVEILRKYPKIRVFEEKITPWRFDAARNRSLELVAEDADICVCTDLDEIFRPGWRQGVEAALEKGAQQIRYRYTWSFLSDGSEGIVFYADKMHLRHGFRWSHPVHEVITRVDGGENRVISAQGIQLDHRADETKSRGQYLPLLELSVEEAPDDDRNMHYLAREYMFHGRYEEAIKTFERHLNMPAALWRDERCASRRYMAKCFFALGKEAEGRQSLFAAISEAPYLREPWLELAEYYYAGHNWHGVIFLINEALGITDRPGTYMTTPQAWSERPYDLLSLAYYYAGDINNALANAEKAAAIAPEDERLQKNKALFKKEQASVYNSRSL